MKNTETPDSWIERHPIEDEPDVPNPEDCCPVCGHLENECVCPPE